VSKWLSCFRIIGEKRFW